MIQIGVVGIGSYGEIHRRAAVKLHGEGVAQLTAVADIKLDAYPAEVAELQSLGVRCYKSYAEMLDKHPDIDLVTLPLPIPLHASVTVDCLRRGHHVLVEKPPAASTEEAELMAATARETGKLCGVGFHLSSSRFFLAACEAIRAGRIGRVTDVSALCLAARDDAYYARTPWAGKIKLGEARVNDGPLNNAFAHMAQIILSFAAAESGKVALPIQVTAEQYAGHAIESEDTNAIRAQLDSGVTLHYFSSHCSRKDWDIILRAKGELGEITWRTEPEFYGEIRLTSGEVIPLPAMFEDGGSTECLFRNFVDVLECRADRLHCSIEDTIAFAKLVEMVFAAGEIRHLAGSPFIVREAHGDSVRTYIEGIDDLAHRAFENGKLYSELGAAFTRAMC